MSAPALASAPPMLPDPLLRLPRAKAQVVVHGGVDAVTSRLPALEAYVNAASDGALTRSPAWLLVLARGLGQTPYCLEAVDGGGRTYGALPLAYLKSILFGRFLVSLPYVNYGGVIADDQVSADALIDRAVELASALQVRFMELRQEQPVAHPDLVRSDADAKVNMRLALPPDVGELWARLSCKVRNQVRKARAQGLTVAWGGAELLDEFHGVFSRNMRDLGTPVYGKALFRGILGQFAGGAEVCVVRAGARPLSAAVLCHGRGVSEVPSAGSLRTMNHTCANMLMYWSMLDRAVSRGQTLFDFGRSTPDSTTFRFKKQWGARPTPTAWQYWRGAAGGADVAAMRPHNPKYRRLIRLWKKLPVCATRLVGPWCVRGIP